MIEVRFPRGEEGARTGVRVALGSDDELVTRAEGVVEWTYAGHAENDRQPRDRVVDRAVARQYATRAMAEATEANREGDLRRARRVIEGTARRILSYAGDDAELHAAAAELQAEIPTYADEVMSAPLIKAAFYRAESMGKGRSPDNRARRRPTT